MGKAQAIYLLRREDCLSTSSLPARDITPLVMAIIIVGTTIQRTRGTRTSFKFEQYQQRSPHEAISDGVFRTMTSSLHQLELHGVPCVELVDKAKVPSAGHGSTMMLQPNIALRCEHNAPLESRTSEQPNRQ